MLKAKLAIIGKPARKTGPGRMRKTVPSSDNRAWTIFPLDNVTGICVESVHEDTFGRCRHVVGFGRNSDTIAQEKDCEIRGDVRLSKLEGSIENWAMLWISILVTIALICPLAASRLKRAAKQPGKRAAGKRPKQLKAAPTWKANSPS